MSFFSTIIIITAIFSLFIGYYFYIKYLEKIYLEQEETKKHFVAQSIKQKQKEKFDKLQKLEKFRVLEQEKQINLEHTKKMKEEKFEKSFLGEKEPVKYYLYNTDSLDYSIKNMYKEIVHKNLWINEPFHTKFYEFLMLVNDNDFMIVDPHSKIIAMNTRDKYNKMQTSKAYQVYSTKDIIKHMISYCINEIKRFNKKDAQNLVISIFIVALKLSVHYLSREVLQDIIDKMLKDYIHSPAIRNIIQMIEAKNEKIYFIQESIYDAFSVVETLPYNDREIPKSLEIKRKISPKVLQNI